MLFNPIEDVSNEKLKILIYGPPGAGKSTFGIGSGMRTAIATTEEKQTRLALAYAKKRGVTHEDSSVMGVNSFSDLQYFYDVVRENQDKLDVVVLDNLTGIQDLLYQEISGSREGDLNFSGWRKLKVNLIDWVRAFRDLDLHVVFIAHYMKMFSEDRGSYVIPSLQGKDTGVLVASELNLVGYLFNEFKQGQTVFQILFKGSDEYMLKGNPYLDAIEAADLRVIINKAMQA